MEFTSNYQYIKKQPLPSGGQYVPHGSGHHYYLDINNVGNGWLQTGAMTRRNHHNAHVIRGNVYIFGGRASPTHLNSQTLNVTDDLDFAFVPELRIVSRIEYFTSIVWNV